jgi:hypothetical protein
MNGERAKAHVWLPILSSLREKFKVDRLAFDAGHSLWLINGRAETLGRAHTRLRSFHFTIAWRSRGNERVEQLSRRLRNLIDGPVEDRFIRL